ncbi:MAG: zinc ribbon domain-containing protein [Bacteroidota bacterium]|nr:zinc ribbon domain-containing protein [Bacteroidota bacterium]
MPTYEYKCDNCGHEFEIYQSMKDEKLTKCSSCGLETLKRLIGSGGGLIFKGSGFYLTDYKNKPTESSKDETSETKKKEPASPSADTNKTGAPKTDTAKSDIKATGNTTSKKSEKKSADSKTDKD